MAYSLSESGKVRYSNAEQRTFALLPQRRNGQTITTRDLALALYGAKALNGRVLVIGTLRSLAKKIRKNREPFRLITSKRSGPHPIEVWLEAK